MNSTFITKTRKPNQKNTFLYDRITSPRYSDAQRNINDIIPLNIKKQMIRKEDILSLSLSLYCNELGLKISNQMTPQPQPVQQGQISANFSASLEWTLRDIRSSQISNFPLQPKQNKNFFILVHKMREKVTHTVN